MTKLAPVIALLALVLAGVALLKGGGSDAPQVLEGGSLGGADLDRVVRALRSEIERDQRARDEQFKKDLDVRLRKLEELRGQWSDVMVKAQARAEGAANLAAGKLDEMGESLASVGAAATKTGTDVGALLTRIDALEKRPVGVAPAPTPTPTPAGDGPAKPKPVEPPKVEMPNAPPEDPAVVKEKVDKALVELDQTDPEILFPAITVVQKYKALEAAPKLVKILAANEDTFIRQASAAALGEMRACDAVEALAEALLDKASMVNQQANKALRMISDHDLGLSPQAKIQERRKARTDMLEWWQRHEDEVRTRWKQPKAPK